MTVEHRGVSRKTFLMYLLQLPFFAGFAKYLYGFEPKKHYLLNKFSVAGFYFYEGTNLLEKMKQLEAARRKLKKDGSTARIKIKNVLQKIEKMDFV